MNSDILYQIKKNSLSEIRNKDKTSSIYVLEFYMVENIKKFLEEKNIKLSKREEIKVISLINDIFAENNIDFILNTEDYSNPKRIYGKHEVNKYIDELRKKKESKDYTIDLDDLDDLDDIAFIIKEFGLVDEKIIIYELLSDLCYGNGNLEKEYEYLSKAWQLANRIDKGQINYRIAIKLTKSYMDLGKYNKIITLYENIKNHESNMTTNQILHLNYNSALAYLKLKDYLEPIKISNYLLEIVESKDYEMLYRIYMLQARCHEELNQHQMAIDNYEKAIEYSKAMGLNKEKYKIYHNISLIYIDLKDHEKANLYLQKVLNELDKKDIAKEDICNILRNIGYLYEKLQDYENAELYYNKSLENSKEISYKDNILKIIGSFLELNQQYPVKNILEIIEENIYMVLKELKEKQNILLKVVNLYNHKKQYTKIDKLMENILNI